MAVVQDYHNGRHFMTEAEQQTFEDFIRKHNWLAALRYLRRAWRKHADMHFLNKFTLVHWARPPKMKNLLETPNPDAEICCQGYLHPPARRPRSGSERYERTGRSGRSARGG